VNALLIDNKLIIPEVKNGIICPGFISNLLIGKASAFISWSFYGAGAAIDVARVNANAHQDISLTFSALAGAFLVRVAGAKWLTNEVDKRVLKESVKQAAKKNIRVAECENIIQQSPGKILQDMQDA
jgi:hypothetical protein